MLKFTGGLISFFLLVLFGCQTKDQAASIPTYLYIPAFTIENENSQTNMDIYSEKISDVWVYLDNDNQGAYELPALIPIAESGDHRIELRPGIKNAGIAVDRHPYPYYELYDLGTYNFKPGTTDTLRPITFYDDAPNPIITAWEEGFEGPGVNYTISPNSDTIVHLIDSANYPELVFKDAKSGAIILEEPGHLFEMISPSLYNLPGNNIPIYLELNYKSNHDFRVGLYLYNKTEQIPIYVVTEQDNWNKIYLDFTKYIAAAPGSDINIFIGFTRSESEPRVEMYLDNIKLIHF